MPFDLSVNKNPNAAKAAALQAARSKAATGSEEAVAIQKWISPADAKERLRILFDDSGSMSSKIKEAKDGTVELFRNCIPNQTAVSVHFLCRENEQLEALNTNLIEAAELLQKAEAGLGGTPLFRTYLKAAALEPKPTRFVMFTDGQPNRETWPSVEDENEKEVVPYQKDADKLISSALELKAPVDTVFFGSEYETEAIKLLKYIAEKTGGYFLHFDPAKVNFKTAFKYLAPINRLQLASESVRREIESGKRN